MKNELILTEDQLKEAVKGYQKRLGLQDWDIEVALVPQKSMPEFDGHANLIIFRKTAFISIPTPESFYSSRQEPMNMLLILCHEMVHLTMPHVTRAIFNSNIEYEFFEQGIELLAKNIVSSKPFDSSGNVEGE